MPGAILSILGNVATSRLLIINGDRRFFFQGTESPVESWISIKFPLRPQTNLAFRVALGDILRQSHLRLRKIAFRIDLLMTALHHVWLRHGPFSGRVFAIHDQGRPME